TTNNNYSYTTSIYHKPTATPLTMNFYSFSPISHRLSVVIGGINRILKLCSSWFLIHNELKNFRSLLLRNNYPSWIIDSIIKRTINKFRNIRSNPEFGPQKERVFLGIPYI